MSIIEIKRESILNQKSFVCLTVDVPSLPTGVDGGSKCRVLDGDQRQYVFDGTNWYPTQVQTSVAEFEISVEITRPSNATAYAVNQIINANGASTLPALDFSTIGNVGGRKIQLNSIGVLSSNGSATTKLNAIIHLFNAATITGQTLTDATAFNPSYAELKTKRATTFENVSSVVNHGAGAFLITQTEVVRNAILDANGKLYVALIANNAYTPASGETITISVKGYLL